MLAFVYYVKYVEGEPGGDHTYSCFMEEMMEKIQSILAEKEDEINQLKSKLRQLEAEKFLFIESTYDGYWDWHIQEDYEYMSPRFWEIFGIDYRTKKHHPDEWKDLIHPDDLKLAYQNLEKHIKTKGEFPYNQEVRYRHANGAWIIVYCRGKIIDWDSNGKPLRMIGTHTDITPFKRIQDELARSNSYLEAFAYSASHDLQEPLRTISNYSKYLLDHLGKKLDEDSREDLFFIYDSALRMKHLVHSLLSYSRIGRSLEKSKPVNTVKLVQEVTSDLTASIEDNQVEIKIDHLPDIFGVETEIRSVFQNLISNAIKYSSVCKPSIHISGNESSDYVTVIVEDNGIGIEDKYLEAIFEVFRRIESQNAKTGSGLGLALCRKVIRSHGGEIKVESDIGKGSRFIINLPKPGKVCYKKSN